MEDGWAAGTEQEHPQKEGEPRQSPGWERQNGGGRDTEQEREKGEGRE